MSWRPLDISPSREPHLPPLLISTAFGPDSYTIHLTDLTHIWSETLERGGILRRSRDVNTSIDPSDSEQLRILLDKIQLGLEGGRDTALALAVNTDAGRPSMTLSVTVPLPGGLAPLEWSIELAAASQQLLTDQLIVPLLEAQQMRMREMASLADMLREKDHVIQKLMDKLEARGTELGQVFPQVAGKAGRAVDRRKAEEKVKGLSRFEMEAWRRGLRSEEPRDVGELVGQVFAADGLSNLKTRNASNVVKEPVNWWDRVKGDSFGLSGGKTPSHGHHGKTSPKRTLKEQPAPDENSDFQIQGTPPHLASPAPKSTGAEPPTDDTTDDEDDEDLDAPSQQSRIPDSFPSSPPKPKPLAAAPRKLGVIGRKKRELPSDPSPPISHESTTGDTSPSPVKEPTSPERRPASSTAAPKPKRVLGRIGGKKEVTPKPKDSTEVDRESIEPTPTPVPTHAPETKSPQPDAAPSPKKKLGVVGGRKIGKAAREEEAGSEAPTETLKKEKEESTTPLPPQPEETEEERADRKREMLRRELEEKARAPVKKKRKF